MESELNIDYVLDNYRGVSKYCLSHINDFRFRSPYFIQMTEKSIICYNVCLPSVASGAGASNPTVRPSTASATGQVRLAERLADAWDARIDASVGQPCWEGRNKWPVTASKAAASRSIANASRTGVSAALTADASTARIRKRMLEESPWC